jgi:UDP-N-acetylglucosamine 4,6-dehydratase/5-epimerase
VVRYGNVIGSRGSVIPFFQKCREKGVLPITDRRMTRFWITLDKGANFVLNCLKDMVGGELFVPKLPSMSIMDLAKAVAPECSIEIVGIRPGEKLHEVMIPRDDARRTLDCGDHFVVQPDFTFWESKSICGEAVPDEFEYNSNDNPWRLSEEDMKELIREYDPLWKAKH